MRISLHSNAYTKIRYPAGEMQIRLTPKICELVKNTKNEITIFGRIHSAEAFIEIQLLADAVASVSNNLVKILLPYLPYSRADRRFCEGDCLGLNVYSALIGYPISSYDIHSLTGNHKFFKISNISPEKEIEKVIKQVANSGNEISVLFPDEGAYKRYHSDVQSQYSNNHKTITVNKYYAIKKRNSETGVFEGFSVPEIPTDVPCLVLDDICDGGGTFIGIAEQLGLSRCGLPKVFHLHTSHGIYSKGLDPLFRYYTSISTTNSFLSTEEYYSLKDFSVLDVF